MLHTTVQRKSSEAFYSTNPSTPTKPYHHYFLPIPFTFVSTVQATIFSSFSSLLNSLRLSLSLSCSLTHKLIHGNGHGSQVAHSFLRHQKMQQHPRTSWFQGTAIHVLPPLSCNVPNYYNVLPMFLIFVFRIWIGV